MPNVVIYLIGPTMSAESLKCKSAMWRGYHVLERTPFCKTPSDARASVLFPGGKYIIIGEL
jgi:hypothetical protein